MGGPQVPAALRAKVREWQETVLGIAKEEMGHLVTVQNLLKALGAPLNLDREDYPWGSDFYPFEFTLQRFALPSLAKYVCAESPVDWSGPEATEIMRVAALAAGQDVNQVGALYGRLSEILSNKAWIPDTAFQAATLPYQASWDEWGRGYRLGDRGQESGNVPAVRTPDLLIIQVWSRDTALSALQQIGQQGEAVDALANDERSHFNRFLGIYRELSGLDPATQELVSRPVADNPTTSQLLNERAPQALAESPEVEGKREISEITESEALSWAHLFNLRYRMLLVNIVTSFETAGPLDNSDSTSARGGLINRSFAEMYNLRAIAGMLVQLPLDAAARQHAGPPFEMPYTIDLPRQPRDRWIQQRELFRASQILIEQTSKLAPPERQRFLVALKDSDALALDQIERIISGR
jgi:rubrerythrin